jgi:hypothetical protein
MKIRKDLLLSQSYGCSIFVSMDGAVGDVGAADHSYLGAGVAVLVVAAAVPGILGRWVRIGHFAGLVQLVAQ